MIPRAISLQPLPIRVACTCARLRRYQHRHIFGPTPVHRPVNGNAPDRGFPTIGLDDADNFINIAVLLQDLTPFSFLINKGRIPSRDILLNEVWGYDYFGTTRTVDVHIARLRQKFPLLEKALVSIKGLGYKLQEDPPKQ